MTRVIVVEKCSECPYGRFLPEDYFGGETYVCVHEYAKNKLGGNTGGIMPRWCPLEKGEIK